MLGNIIGGFIVILVGTTLNEKLVLMEETPFETAEFRLKPLRGQDRSVNIDLESIYARETDKAYFSFFNKNECKIYSPNFGYKMKPKINKMSPNSSTASWNSPI
jgi:hypothetical protein